MDLGGQGSVIAARMAIDDAGGKVLDGPAPRGLDPLPIKVTPAGDITIIDMEFKAGTKAQVRIV